MANGRKSIYDAMYAPSPFEELISNLPQQLMQVQQANLQRKQYEDRVKQQKFQNMMSIGGNLKGYQRAQFLKAMISDFPEYASSISALEQSETSNMNKLGDVDSILDKLEAKNVPWWEAKPLIDQLESPEMMPIWQDNNLYSGRFSRIFPKYQKQMESGYFEISDPTHIAQIADSNKRIGQIKNKLITPIDERNELRAKVDILNKLKAMDENNDPNMSDEERTYYAAAKTAGSLIKLENDLLAKNRTVEDYQREIRKIESDKNKVMAEYKVPTMPGKEVIDTIDDTPAEDLRMAGAYVLRPKYMNQEEMSNVEQEINDSLNKIYEDDQPTISESPDEEPVKRLTERQINIRRQESAPQQASIKFKPGDPDAPKYSTLPDYQIARNIAKEFKFINETTAKRHRRSLEYGDRYKDQYARDTQAINASKKIIKDLLASGIDPNTGNFSDAANLELKRIGANMDNKTKAQFSNMVEELLGIQNFAFESSAKEEDTPEKEIDINSILFGGSRILGQDSPPQTDLP